MYTYTYIINGKIVEFLGTRNPVGGIFNRVCDVAVRIAFSSA